uniref:Uncharacterized protein n=1 Tax=Sphaeramia orbicularis TaxID=375764 RepID=A0A673B642_9TELE
MGIWVQLLLLMATICHPITHHYTFAVWLVSLFNNLKCTFDTEIRNSAGKG